MKEQYTIIIDKKKEECFYKIIRNHLSKNPTHIYCDLELGNYTSKDFAIRFDTKEEAEDNVTEMWESVVRIQWHRAK